METNNIRPSNLGAVGGNQNFGSDIKKRAGALAGMLSPGAQMNNTGNYKTISIDRLIEFKNHPFNVHDDGELEELAQSIKESGLMEAILVRPVDDEHYEILAGHRRVAAAQKIGMQDITAKILNVDDSEAAIIMTNTNLKRREKILPSERARAYKIQLEAYKCQGKRSDLINKIESESDFRQICPEVQEMLENNFRQICPKVESRDIVAEMNRTTSREISRYVRLNHLILPLLDLVDMEVIALNAGVALSFLSEDEQQMVVNAMNEGIIKKIDLKAAEELKTISKSGQLNETVISQMFSKIDNSAKPQDTYAVFQNATKKALKHFKKTDYQNVQINQEELEQILVEAIKNYAENRV